MQKLKAKARTLNPGIVSTPSAVTIPKSTATKRGRVSKVNGGPIRKKIKQEPTDDEEDDFDELADEQLTSGLAEHAHASPAEGCYTSPVQAFPTTTPSPAGNDEVTDVSYQKIRSSPRENVKPDYRQMEDPFVSMDGATDEAGENVFGNVGGLEDEDSLSSDEEFIPVKKVRKFGGGRGGF